MIETIRKQPPLKLKSVVCASMFQCSMVAEVAMDVTRLNQLLCLLRLVLCVSLHRLQLQWRGVVYNFKQLDDMFYNCKESQLII